MRWQCWHALFLSTADDLDCVCIIYWHDTCTLSISFIISHEPNLLACFVEQINEQLLGLLVSSSLITFVEYLHCQVIDLDDLSVAGEKKNCALVLRNKVT